MELKQQFEAELEVFLLEAEKALLARDVATAKQVSMDIMKLVARYSDKLDRTTIREVLNGPLPTRIFERLTGGH